MLILRFRVRTRLEGLDFDPFQTLIHKSAPRCQKYEVVETFKYSPLETLTSLNMGAQVLYIKKKPPHNFRRQKGKFHKSVQSYSPRLLDTRDLCAPDAELSAYSFN